MNDSAPRRIERDGGFDPDSILAKMKEAYWTELEKAPEPEPEDLVFLLVFRIGAERFALPVDAVREITRVPPIIAKLPRGAEHFMGVMNLRGQIIPILDMRPVLDVPRGEASKEARIVVLRGRDGDLSLFAEEVEGMIELSASEWMAPLNVETALPQAFVKAQARDGRGLLVVLDAEAFLGMDSVGSVFR